MNNEDAARITEIPDTQRNGPYLSGSRVYSSTDKAVLDFIGDDVKEMIHMGDGNDAEEIARNEFARVPGVDGHWITDPDDDGQMTCSMVIERLLNHRTELRAKVKGLRKGIGTLQADVRVARNERDQLWEKLATVRGMLEDAHAAEDRWAAKNGELRAERDKRDEDAKALAEQNRKQAAELQDLRRGNRNQTTTIIELTRANSEMREQFRPGPVNGVDPDARQRGTILQGGDLLNLLFQHLGEDEALSVGEALWTNGWRPTA